MPTVHLSLPEHVYSRLKAKAEELGIQITDLIKVFIKKGLDGELGGEGRNAPQYYAELLEHLESYKKETDTEIEKLRNRMLLLEGAIYQIRELIVNYILKRIDEIQDSIDELKGAEVTPEFIHQRK